MSAPKSDDPKSGDAVTGPSAGASIAIRHLNHSYRRSDGPVLSDISLDVAPGQICALLGRSGCGKSTLLHLIAGLGSASSGEITIDGIAVKAPSPKWVMMFQAPSLLPWLTAAQNVALGLRFTGRKADIPRRVPEVLNLVDLSAYADRNVQSLSGGQQQRVALARSLAPSPDLLLLDEPFSALDAFTRRALQGDVRRIARELGLTMILVTHDVGEAVRMADRVILLRSGPGRIAEETRIDLAEDARSGDSPAFQHEEARLMAAYARIAGFAPDASGETE